MWPKFKVLWHCHGTKVLGYGIYMLGVLSTLDTATINLVSKTLGPIYGPYFSGFCMISAGLGVAARGYRNQHRDPPP